MGEEIPVDQSESAGGVAIDEAAPRPTAAAAAPRTWDHGPHPHRALVAWIAVAAVVVGFAWPAVATVQEWLRSPRPQLENAWSAADSVRLVLMQAGWAAWVFAMGAAVGSFLNVVVHRLPAGRSVVFGPSACPACDTGIRPDDNLPILGWLRLGGRCRRCGTLIAARYPLVEATMAGLCLGLCSAELLSGGATLPLREPDDSAGLAWIVLQAPWDLIGIHLYHVVAVAVLLVWALIAADGRPLPARHVVATLAVMGIVPAVFPWLHPVPVVHPRLGMGSPPVDSLEPGWLWQGLLVSLAGMAAGGGLGAAWQAVRGFSGARAPAAHATGPVGPSVAAIPALLALVGTVLGWQAVPAVALGGLLAQFAVSAAIRCRAGCGTHHLPQDAAPDLKNTMQGFFPGQESCSERIAPELTLLFATVVHLVAWRWIVAAWSAV